jgi:hypothetical protein
MLLSSRKDIDGTEQRPTDLAAFTNGLVFDVTDIANPTVLSVPPLAPVRATTFPLDAYTVHTLYDGSVITVYHFNGAWSFATARGYDVGALCWNTLTYAEIWSQCSREAAYGFDVTTLDPNFCYSFVVRHPDVHVFTGARPLHALMFLQSIDLRLFSKAATPAETPSATPAETPSATPAETPTVTQADAPLINSRATAAKPTKRLPESDWRLYQLALSTTPPEGSGGVPLVQNDTLNTVGDVAASAGRFTLERYAAGRPNVPAAFGYVLRSVDVTRTTAHSVVIIETPVYKKLRRVLYARPMTRAIFERKYRREVYIALRSLLDYRDAVWFPVLFPETVEFAKAFQLIMVALSRAATRLIRGNDRVADLSEIRRTIICEDPRAVEQFLVVVQCVADRLGRVGSHSGPVTTSWENVRDTLMQPRSVATLYELFTYVYDKPTLFQRFEAPKPVKRPENRYGNSGQRDTGPRPDSRYTSFSRGGKRGGR